MARDGVICLIFRFQVVLQLLRAACLCEAFVALPQINDFNAKSKSFLPSRKNGPCLNRLRMSLMLKPQQLGNWHLVEANISRAHVQAEESISSEQVLLGNPTIEFCEPDELYRSFLLPGNVSLRIRQLSFMEV
jgi:hypothetical protein